MPDPFSENPTLQIYWVENDFYYAFPTSSVHISFIPMYLVNHVENKYIKKYASKFCNGSNYTHLAVYE